MQTFLALQYMQTFLAFHFLGSGWRSFSIGNDHIDLRAYLEVIGWGLCSTVVVLLLIWWWWLWNSSTTNLPPKHDRKETTKEKNSQSVTQPNKSKMCKLYVPYKIMWISVFTKTIEQSRTCWSKLAVPFYMGLCSLAWSSSISSSAMGSWTCFRKSSARSRASSRGVWERRPRMSLCSLRILSVYRCCSWRF